MLRVVILVFSVFMSALVHAAPRDPGEHFFEETFGDFQEELELAREDGKQAVLIFFQMDDCPFCHRMKTTVLNQPEVQDYYRAHFRIFSVDVEGAVEITDFQGRQTTQQEFAFAQHRVRATPVFAFFNLDGELIARYTGPTRDVGEFLRLGEYVVDGHYRTQSFASFKRDRSQSAGQ